MKNVYAILGIAFFLSGIFTGLHAQELKSTQTYRDSIPAYNQWLQKKQMSDYLRVHDVLVEGQQVNLYLEFQVPYHEAGPVWDSLNNRLMQRGGYGPAKLLFFAMLNTFKVPPQQAEIRIFDTYDPLENPKDTVGIYYEDDSVQAYLGFTQAKAADAGIRSVEVNKLVPGGRQMSLVNYGETRSEAYRRILDYLETYFQPRIDQMEGDDEWRNYFTVFQDEDEDALKVRISGMQREVLDDRENPWVARIANWVFGYDMDWTPVEILEVTVEMTVMDNQEMELRVDLNGRCGSGVYESVTWANGNNMEPAFDTYLTRYANNLAQDIKDVLE